MKETRWFCKVCGEIAIMTQLNGVIRVCGHDDAPVLSRCGNEFQLKIQSAIIKGVQPEYTSEPR